MVQVHGGVGRAALVLRDLGPGHVGRVQALGRPRVRLWGVHIALGVAARSWVGVGARLEVLVRVRAPGHAVLLLVLWERERLGLWVKGYTGIISILLWLNLLLLLLRLLLNLLLRLTPPRHKSRGT